MPSNHISRCECCGRHTNLVHDHCHSCGHWRGWICDPCNLAITEHAEDHWRKLAEYQERHSCHPMLPGMPEILRTSKTRSHQRESNTEQVYFNNGEHDRRSYLKSKQPGYVSFAQLAAFLGTTVPHIRKDPDVIAVREKVGGVAPYLVPVDAAVNIIIARVARGALAA